MKTTVTRYTAFAVCYRVPPSHRLDSKRVSPCGNKASRDGLQLLLGIKHHRSCDIAQPRSLQPRVVLGGRLPFSNLNFETPSDFLIVRGAVLGGGSLFKRFSHIPGDTNQRSRRDSGERGPYSNDISPMISKHDEHMARKPIG